VDETLARSYWPGESALGKCLVLGQADGPCRWVIAVVEDQRWSRVVEGPTLQFFLPLEDSAVQAQAVVLRVHPQQWGSIAAGLRTAAQPIQDAATHIGRMSDLLEAQYRPWRVGAALFSVFGLIALFVTSVGAYGVIAYSVTQRTSEVGVRLALGARVHTVVAMIVGDSLRLVSVGIVAGIIVALALGELVESLLFGIGPRDPYSAVLAAVTLLLAGTAASLVPALRAGLVSPLECLRED
jgi:ABC-type antimicrobial peptide transport system permease subunit